MIQLIEGLTELVSSGTGRILFVGIGNVLKQDDGAGVYISRRIKPRNNILVLTVEASIENYIGKINSLDPDTLVLIDCADLGLEPGNARLLSVNEITDITFNTHNISLKRICEFFSAKVLILGIQPVSVGFGENISYLVRSVSDKIINLINKEEVSHGS